MFPSNKIVSIIAICAFTSADSPRIRMLGKNPEKFEGEEVADHSGGNPGECVSFVKVCTGDKRATAQWVQGQKVRGANIPSGTAIATFPGGKYSGHAAIYISQDKNGIRVWDQWTGHAVSQRTISWNGGPRISNNGDSFYVIN